MKGYFMKATLVLMLVFSSTSFASELWFYSFEVKARATNYALASNKAKRMRAEKIGNLRILCEEEDGGRLEVENQWLKSAGRTKATRTYEAGAEVSCQSL